MILVDVVFLHSAVTSGCRLSSEMSMTEITPENTESFSTRAFQATASIPNAEFTNFASKHCSEWWHNDLDREPRTVIHVKRAKMFDPMG